MLNEFDSSSVKKIRQIYSGLRFEHWFCPNFTITFANFEFPEGSKFVFKIYRFFTLIFFKKVYNFELTCSTTFFQFFRLQRQHTISQDVEMCYYSTEYLLLAPVHLLLKLKIAPNSRFWRVTQPTSADFLDSFPLKSATFSLWHKMLMSFDG